MSKSVSSQISASSGLSNDSAQAIEATITTLIPGSSISPDNSLFDASHLALVRAGSSPSPESIRNLVLTAQGLVNSLRDRGSILAGLRSESDEYGDVGVWLGQGEFGISHERSVLRALGLDNWLEGNIVPDTFRDPTVDALDLSPFEDIYRFRVEGNGDSVALFMLGRTKEGWGGLASVATWS